MELFQDLSKYLKEIFGESQRIVFTAFDLIGIGLFFFPRIAQGLVDNEVFARSIGGLIFFISFLLANFNLFRRLTAKQLALNKDSLLLYPFENPPNNSAELRYIGPEPIKDVEVWLKYIEPPNEYKQKQVEQFFPQNDPKMIWHQYKANVINENDIVRFHLLQRKSTADGKVTVEVKFVGAKSGRPVLVKKEFNLKL
jgi:hypothetical protein